MSRFLFCQKFKVMHNVVVLNRAYGYFGEARFNILIEEVKSELYIYIICIHDMCYLHHIFISRFHKSCIQYLLR